MHCRICRVFRITFLHCTKLVLFTVRWLTLLPSTLSVFGQNVQQGRVFRCWRTSQWVGVQVHATIWTSCNKATNHIKVLTRSIHGAIVVRIQTPSILTGGAQRTHTGNCRAYARRVETEVEGGTEVVVDVSAESDERVASVEQHHSVLLEKDLGIEEGVGRSQLVLCVNGRRVI